MTHPHPPQRSGAFGRSTRASGDKSSFGLQRARNASQGRAQGGARPGPRKSVTSITKSRAQMFTQRVGNIPGQPQPSKSPGSPPGNVGGPRPGLPGIERRQTPEERERWLRIGRIRPEPGIGNTLRSKVRGLKKKAPPNKSLSNQGRGGMRRSPFARRGRGG